ncbi:hypothetical protein BsWGS_02798 [Bradybaena similaris]
MMWFSLEFRQFLMCVWIPFFGASRRTTAAPTTTECPEGLWTENCTERCAPGCSSGCEKYSGKCLHGCGPGWTGNNCDLMCPSFTYGVKCLGSCGHCHEESPCNIVNGRCSDGCLAGFRGERCDRGCKPQTFGVNCNRSCGHCRNNQTCNPMTGICSSGCERGWLRQTCDEACPHGTYGSDCRERCAHCAGNTTCHHETGICEEGCAPGWIGELCSQACDVGRYGSGCRGICGRCLKGECDHVTGECHGGCSKGFQGRQCKEECPSGWYGENCSSECGHCQTTSGCDPVSGICLNRCAPGWQGVFCTHNCSLGSYGEDCKFACGHCQKADSCDTTSGTCPHGCESGWKGERCDTGELETATSFHTSSSFPILVICLVVAFICIVTFFTYCMIIRPRKTLRRLYNASSAEHLPNTYEQIVGSPWEIQRGQLSISNELLGNGQFGQVKKGYVKNNGVKIPVAIKSLKGVMYVAMEYAKHGDLRTFLRQCRRLTSLQGFESDSALALHGSLRPQVLIKLSLDTARGLKHLADKQIIHRDVAARNVLLGDKLVAKIADFGLSKNDQTYVKTSSTRVPIKWMAMESLFTSTYTLQSDVWSFGILLWEIFTLGGTPYSSIDSQQLFKYLKDGFRLRKPKLCSQDMYSMMLQCWNDDPERRPTIDELTARLDRMMENSQVYMNINLQEESLYAEIEHELIS